eukprot:TRINITY_DN28029_c0_g1_i1.p1 TRINITY_DN28029_c0_g1~~TRINITY_DN28029_c0_g1_i1.p1  ORF type:complete len:1359 (+),score=321.33 TRINITY_DN28029_c0_g1_i1:181-4077(+)
MAAIHVGRLRVNWRAAEAIQQAGRGHAGRVALCTERARLALTGVATRLQRTGRGLQSRLLARMWHDHNARVIQRVGRGLAARCDMDALHRARCAGLLRGCLRRLAIVAKARRFALEHERLRATRRKVWYLQRVGRRLAASRRVAAGHLCVRRLQRIGRGLVRRHSFGWSRRIDAVCTMQRFGRCVIAKDRAAEQRRVVSRLRFVQRCGRGLRGRVLVRVRRTWTDACCAMQRAWRCHAARVRLHRRRETTAAVFLIARVASGLLDRQRLGEGLFVARDGALRELQPIGRAMRVRSDLGQLRLRLQAERKARNEAKVADLLSRTEAQVRRDAYLRLMDLKDTRREQRGRRRRNFAAARVIEVRAQGMLRASAYGRLHENRLRAIDARRELEGKLASCRALAADCANELLRLRFASLLLHRKVRQRETAAALTVQRTGRAVLRRVLMHRRHAEVTHACALLRRTARGLSARRSCGALLLSVVGASALPFAAAAAVAIARIERRRGRRRHAELLSERLARVNDRRAQAKRFADLRSVSAIRREMRLVREEQTRQAALLLGRVVRRQRRMVLARLRNHRLTQQRRRARLKEDIGRAVELGVRVQRQQRMVRFRTLAAHSVASIAARRHVNAVVASVLPGVVAASLSRLRCGAVFAAVPIASAVAAAAAELSHIARVAEAARLRTMHISASALCTAAAVCGAAVCESTARQRHSAVASAVLAATASCSAVDASWRLRRAREAGAVLCTYTAVVAAAEVQRVVHSRRRMAAQSASSVAAACVLSIASWQLTVSASSSATLAAAVAALAGAERCLRREAAAAALLCAAGGYAVAAAMPVAVEKRCIAACFGLEDYAAAGRAHDGLLHLQRRAWPVLRDRKRFLQRRLRSRSCAAAVAVAAVAEGQLDLRRRQVSAAALLRRVGRAAAARVSVASARWSESAFVTAAVDSIRVLGPAAAVRIAAAAVAAALVVPLAAPWPRYRRRLPSLPPPDVPIYTASAASVLRAAQFSEDDRRVCIAADEHAARRTALREAVSGARRVAGRALLLRVARGCSHRTRCARKVALLKGAAQLRRVEGERRSAVAVKEAADRGCTEHIFVSDAAFIRAAEQFTSAAATLTRLEGRQRLAVRMAEQAARQELLQRREARPGATPVYSGAVRGTAALLSAEEQRRHALQITQQREMQDMRLAAVRSRGGRPALQASKVFGDHPSRTQLSSTAPAAPQLVSPLTRAASYAVSVLSPLTGAPFRRAGSASLTRTTPAPVSADPLLGRQAHNRRTSSATPKSAMPAVRASIANAWGGWADR